MVKRKIVRKRMAGGAWYDSLWSGIKSVGSVVNDLAKKTGAISKIATATGHPEIGGVAGALGYGRRMRGGKRKRPRGVIVT
jgi:hypothetical protein